MKGVGWRSVAGVGTGIVLAALALGQQTLHSVFELACLAAAISIVAGLKRHAPAKRSPWYFFALSATFFFTSYGLRLFVPELQPRASGEPTLADFIDALGYLSAIIAVYQLGQVRDSDKDPTTIIDSLILTAGISTVIWVAVLLPYLRDTDLVLSGRILGASLAVLSVWLAFGAVRLTLGPSLKAVSSTLLSVAAGCAVAAEVATTAWSNAQHVWVLSSGALALIYMGSAALHPTMVAMTQPSSQGISRMTGKRYVSMTVAVLIAPALLLTKLMSDSNDLVYSSGLIVCWVTVTVLVMIRFAGLVRARERVAEVERVLSRAAATLVSATERSETYESALLAMEELADTGNGFRGSVAIREEDSWTVVCSRGIASDAALDRSIDSAFIESMLRSDDLAPLQLADTLPLDAPHIGRCSTVIAPLVSHGRVRGALLVSTPRPLPSNTVDALGALAADVSLAVEAAGLTEDLHRRRSEQRFRSLVENSVDIILVIAADGTTTFASPAAERFFGRRSPTLASLLQLVHKQDVEGVEHLIASPARQGGAARPLEFRVVQGVQVGWLEMTVTDLSADDEINGLVLNARDVTERRAAQAESELREARFRSLVQHSSDLTAVLDHRGTITYVSPAVEALLGHTTEALVGSDLRAVTHPDDRQVINDLAGLLLTAAGATRQTEIRMANAAGEWKTLEVTLTDLRHEPSIEGIVMNAHDVTDRKDLENDLRHKVLHDDLTGIANRVLFRDRVEHALRAREARPNAVTAVLFVDIDDFKTINDGLGHDVGDELLKVIAFRMESFVRSGDTAARLGGDEFAVLFEDLYTVDDVMRASDRLLIALNQPVQFGRREITVSASIGVALADPDTDGETLLRNADVAMYHAKQTGKGRVKLFDHSMFVSAFERLELKADLARALERNELTLFYQPLIGLGTGSLVGFEALMRWTHPTRGFVSPASFIPLAEETGLIVELGEWALNEALAHLSSWQSQYQCDVGMSVNVSPRQFENESLVEQVRSALERHCVPASSVTLELTEGEGLDDAIKQERFVALRNLGCQLAADDFGTGFASYAALQQLPFTNVKIDRSLITGLSDGDSKAQAQVRSIIQMGQALGLSITAEGIEDARQADSLIVMGADKGQGYLFGKPMPAQEAEERVRQQAAALVQRHA